MEKTSRMTKQRKRILEILRNTKSHPTADWIYNQVREEMPNISLGTVYRNLGLLKEKGEILELNYGSSFSRYDGKAHNHYHFTCDRCEGVFDVDMPLQEHLAKEILLQEGHIVLDHRLEFKGICNNCREKDNN